MSDAVRKIVACRLCGADELRRYVDFGDVPLGNNLQEDQTAARAAASYPLALDRCESCGHFQLGHAVAPDLLYATNYTYLSGIGSSFVKHFAGYAEWAKEMAGVGAGSLVVDVGSNDGTCLKAFQERGATVCGVDPASLAARIANENGVETINAFFDARAVATIIDRHGQADFVTSHNVLAHVDDLAEVFRNIHALLKDGGHFAFEIGYFREVLRTGCFDTIYHEHLDYHHAAPLVRHLTGLGFDVIDLSVNSVQGGSLRLLLRKTGDGEIHPQAAAFLAEEKQSVLYDDAFLKGWKRRIEDQMRDFHHILGKHAANGATIIAYGAPTKATLLMKMAGLTGEQVSFVVEDNVHKAGRYLPGTGVAIRPSAALATAEPDVIVIFAWNFADDIIGKLRGAFDRPVEIIVPLPELRTLSL
ncbi:class I SAM-dependent methyltransferase [Sphingomonas sp.]|uniref:class I SAM-dependent methyltransferase n=1 Tax=Sphingomonas sp. TaxID=28214 RepID=UPI001ED7B26C|nr:class I SAM-dependent methyltransferase [Sphingomonas sp.]MBX3594753.1 class I SAM-dependent methyltransferase [Sphingomonas sp.]